jgi:hypothetical protein
MVNTFGNEIATIVRKYQDENPDFSKTVFMYNLNLIAAVMSEGILRSGSEISSFEDDMLLLLVDCQKQIMALCERHQRYEDTADRLMVRQGKRVRESLEQLKVKVRNLT